MYNTNIPSERELPSTSKLIKSTIIAAITAGVLLLTVVMPAEYGIDHTGVGEIIGLKRMGEIRISLDEEEKADTAKIVEAAQAVVEVKEVKKVVEVVKTEAVEAQTVIAPNNKADQNHEMTFTLAPDEAAEVKVTMTKGAKVSYIWQTDGGKSNFDVHGDSKKLKISYHPYYKGTDSKREGTLEAAFDGGHGWFWRNRTKNSLTITIKTAGEYTAIKRY
ncbi:MAG: hypothetical protein ACJAUP_003628 [Cellvibrionaceae bacterium]|jgi:hypothetical protein